MKMFSDCSGPCCICGCSGGCLAGHGDDDFCLASSEQVIERLKNGEYEDDKETMIFYLRRKYGIDYEK